MKAELVLDQKCVLGEGPWWDGSAGTLWWIDGIEEHGIGNMLFRYDPKTGINQSVAIKKHLGCAIPTTDGRILLALQDGLWLFDWEKRSFSDLCDLEREITNNRINDGKADSKGRLWVGSMSMTANQETEFEITGSFYRFSMDDGVVKQFGGVGISNGIAWNADETQMYYIDSTTHAVFAFDFDSETGTLSNRRVAISIDPTEGIPDGMTIDAEDMIWVAHFGGGKVSRFNPVTQKRLAEILLPCDEVTSCCFGGEALDTLYITTASIGLSPALRAAQPLAGGLFAARPGVCGRQLFRFEVKHD
jgi:sugar lactone lactonase YvrE